MYMCYIINTSKQPRWEGIVPEEVALRIPSHLSLDKSKLDAQSRLNDTRPAADYACRRTYGGRHTATYS
jgi:hypothetical protein